ncbi:HEL190Wp [Eremothecium sinecaudum]|uniref:HEL190Wp n=1 Tax=Eremothecium sinecaudum TaxID=45286 RepID=A0A120K2C4_9SACH|nr:HEL190Wp [Eremothecium sinecaudum]AMD21091.1 HEL190Wp [Eremothecium sinecaudum]
MANLVIPGDRLHIEENKQVSAGPGVYCDPKTQQLRLVNAGLEVVNETKKGQSVYIEYNSKRYTPAVGDYVIVTIIASFSDSYKVSLSSFSTPVVLSYMSFPNATKKNKPTLKVGDLCYARVSVAEKDLLAELECMDSTTGKVGGFGLLEGGVVVDVPLAFSRELLFNNEYPLLPMLAKYTQLEVAIGVNGKIWINTEDVRTTLACYRSIKDCSTTTESQFKSVIKTHFKGLINSVE